MTFDYYQYDICGHYLPAIINGDYSGLSDAEEAEVNHWLDTLPAEAAYGHWDISDECPDFRRDDVSGLMGDCVTCRLMFPVEG